MKYRHKARILAVQALYAWDLQEIKSMEYLSDFQWENEVKNEVKVFASFLINGTINNLDQIDKGIKDKLVKWTMERLNKVDLAILRISVFSLIHIKDIPKAVTINEAVELAKEFGSDKSFQFINGILDKISITLGDGENE